jgi:signal transduction histidine kinase
MNETDSQHRESNQNSDEWKSWPPELYLAVLLHELRTPIMMIKGYAQILSNESAGEHHLQAIENISRTAERLEQIWEGIAEYRSHLAGRHHT